MTIDGAVAGTLVTWRTAVPSKSKPRGKVGPAQTALQESWDFRRHFLFFNAGYPLLSVVRALQAAAEGSGARGARTLLSPNSSNSRVWKRAGEAGGALRSHGAPRRAGPTPNCACPVPRAPRDAPRDARCPWIPGDRAESSPAARVLRTLIFFP